MKKIALLSLMVLVFAGNIPLEAKNKYQVLDSKEGVEFSYKWKPSKCLKKDSPLILIIKIANNNDYAANIAYTVDFFWQGLKTATSEEQSFCIKANKSLVGKIRKFDFDRSKYSNEQILSDQFIMELTGIKVAKTENCTK